VWFLALAPRFDRASELGEQVESAQVRRDQAESNAAAALAARGAYPANYATVARLGKAVPVDDEIPSLLYQLDSAAKATGNDFRVIKLTGGGAASATPTPAAAAPSDSKSKDEDESDSETSTSAAPATQVAAATLPPGAAIGPAGLPAMPFTFTFHGSFFRLEHFLRRVDAFTKVSDGRISVGGRLLTLNGISLTAAPAGFPHIRASISATGFLVPATEGLTAGATPAGPATVAQGSKPAVPATTVASVGVAR
jgi:hypothetical protein